MEPNSTFSYSCNFNATHEFLLDECSIAISSKLKHSWLKELKIHKTKEGNKPYKAQEGQNFTEMYKIQDFSIMGWYFQ